MFWAQTTTLGTIKGKRELHNGWDYTNNNVLKIPINPIETYSSMKFWDIDTISKLTFHIVKMESETPFHSKVMSGYSLLWVSSILNTHVHTYDIFTVHLSSMNAQASSEYSDMWCSLAIKAIPPHKSVPFPFILYFHLWPTFKNFDHQFSLDPLVGLKAW